MAKYVVVVHGENCVLWQAGARPHSFYVTRYLEARSTERAEQLALGLIAADRRLAAGARNAPDDPIRLVVEETVEVDAFPPQLDLLPGFFFLRVGDPIGPDDFD